MKRFKRILYVNEPLAQQQATLARAASLARNNQATLTLLDVLPEMAAGIGMSPGGPISQGLMQRLTDERLTVLKTLAAHYTDGKPFTCEVHIGKRFLEVIHAVQRDNYDLVVKPAENPDWIDRLFGSDDMHLLRKCPVPVWLMHEHEKSNYGTILAAVGSPPGACDPQEEALNRHIAALAGSLALSDFAELHLVHVWESPGIMLTPWITHPEKMGLELEIAVRQRHQQLLDKVVGDLKTHLGREAWDYLSPRAHLVQGVPNREIPLLAHELGADLLVMGTVARTGIAGLFIGNTAESILDQLRCSVLAIKPEGFVSPV
ncbi:MAG: universal stress protein [Planctomycetes bacterium]|nr:universal stress protein [Planctomycetota bacterium]